MSDLRTKCEHRDRCGQSGHYRTESGDWKRCRCLTLEVNRRRLGAMFCESPREDTPLSGCIGKDLMIEGTLNDVRAHVAGALLREAEEGRRFVILDAYRLIEIFLEKDVEFPTLAAATDADLLIILMGFGDPRNKYLPELLLQALNRRELVRKPTWVILGIPSAQLEHKYGETVGTKIKTFQRARVR